MTATIAVSRSTLRLVEYLAMVARHAPGSMRAAHLAPPAEQLAADIRRALEVSP